MIFDGFDKDTAGDSAISLFKPLSATHPVGTKIWQSDDLDTISTYFQQEQQEILPTTKTN